MFFLGIPKKAYFAFFGGKKINIQNQWQGQTDIPNPFDGLVLEVAVKRQVKYGRARQKDQIYGKLFEKYA